MKKIRSIRVSAALLAATLMTTCLAGGTFAAYTTSTLGETEARVAFWGFTAPVDIDMSDLFSSSYTNVAAADSDAVIAPRTSGSMTFSFPFDESSCDAPEVNYKFKIVADLSADESITGNSNIQFALDSGSWTDLDGLKAQILALSGDASGIKTYAAGTLPDEFSEDDDVHTIKWQWLYEATEAKKVSAGNAADSAMGNDVTNNQLIDFSIQIEAAQVD